MNYNLLNKSWFRKNQNLLRFCLNAPILGLFVRLYMHIPIKNNILKVLPDSIHFQVGEKVRSRIYSSNVVAKDVVRKFALLFWVMHFLDIPIDKFIPQFSFGFTSITINEPSQPGSGGENVTCDGIIKRFVGASHSWYEIRNWADGEDNDYISWSTSGSIITCHALTGLDGYYYMEFIRGYMSFDLSSIVEGSTIEDAHISLYGKYEKADLGADYIYIMRWTRPHTGLYNDINGQEQIGSYPTIWAGDWKNINFLEQPEASIGHDAFLIGYYNILQLQTNWLKDNIGSQVGYTFMFRADALNDQSLWGSMPYSYGVNKFETYAADNLSNSVFISVDYEPGVSLKMVMIV
jgi:hypothetical protein